MVHTYSTPRSSDKKYKDSIPLDYSYEHPFGCPVDEENISPISRKGTQYYNHAMQKLTPINTRKKHLSLNLSVKNILILHKTLDPDSHNNTRIVWNSKFIFLIV